MITELDYVKAFPFTFELPSQDMDVGFRVCEKCGNHLQHWAESHDGAHGSTSRIDCIEHALWGMASAAMEMLKNLVPEGWPLMKAVVEYREEVAEILERTAAERRGRLN